MSNFNLSVFEICEPYLAKIGAFGKLLGSIQQRLHAMRELTISFSVALNYQTDDRQNLFNRAMFTANGGCGYILKPRYLRWFLLTVTPVLLMSSVS